MLRQQGSALNGSTAAANGGGSGSPRVRMLLPGAEPGMYLSPRARAALLRQERGAAAAAAAGAGGDAASVASSSVSPLRLPRSLPEAYHSIAVPRARPGESSHESAHVCDWMICLLLVFDRLLLSLPYDAGEPSSWGRRLRTLAAYVGPGYMVAVGYMDPGACVR